MKFLVVTTYNNRLYKEYGSRFANTYNWDFPYTVYNEDDGMFEAIPDCKAFVERNKNRIVPNTSNGFFVDGVRFCYKVYAYTHAIMNYTDYDGIIGIDADSVFYKKIDWHWIEEHIHRDDCMMSYLGRGDHYSECGFLYFNLRHPDTQAYANRMKHMYDTDSIYNLKEQHDSYVWDYVRKEFENRGTKNYDLGDGKAGHVQARSILGTIYDHTKGERKIKGRSKEFRG